MLQLTSVGRVVSILLLFFFGFFLMEVLTFLGTPEEMLLFSVGMERNELY